MATKKKATKFYVQTIADGEKGRWSTISPPSGLASLTQAENFIGAMKEKGSKYRILEETVYEVS